LLRHYIVPGLELLCVIRDYAGEIPGIMKAFQVLAVLSVAFSAAQAQIVEEPEFCYNDVARACHFSVNPNKQGDVEVPACNSRYGAIGHLEGDLQAYVNMHIARSFEYLMMATRYANYEENRKGFADLFRGLSDSKWDTAIDLIKYITKRGGSMDFNRRKADKVNGEGTTYELYELQAMAKALDMEKDMAAEAHALHGDATRRRADAHDPEISSYIEEKFVHKQADLIRELSGHTNDLKTLLDGPDASLALYLFDEYLQKK